MSVFALERECLKVPGKVLLFPVHAHAAGVQVNSPDATQLLQREGVDGTRGRTPYPCLFQH